MSVEPEIPAWWASTPATAYNAMATHKTPSVSELLAACREFQRRFPPSTIAVRADVSPLILATLRLHSQSVIWPSSIVLALSGIRLHVDRSLPPEVYVIWYADGHFEVFPPMGGE